MVDLEGMINSRSAAARPVESPVATRVDSESFDVGPARQPLIAGAVISILFVWLFWDWLRSQFNWATQYPADWGHTLVIPFISGYFIYLKRDKLLAQPFRTTWLGLVPIIVGIAWYMITTIGPPTLRQANLEAAGLWLTLVGLMLLFFGWRAMIWLWFPLLYLFIFGQTISYRLMEMVTFKMQDVTARGAFYVLALGADVQREGNTIYILGGAQPKPLNIAEACSGMRMLMAFVALGVAMAHTGFQRFWQQALLVLLAVPTAIVVNILRVVTLGILSIFDSDLAAGDFHSFIGLLWLVPAFLIYLGLMWIISHLVIEDSTPVSRAT